MRHALALTALLAATLLTGCAQRQAMQQRIDTLEARVAELEARPTVWPFEMTQAEQPAQAQRPWWDPAPVWQPGLWGPDYGRWYIPGFELDLSHETVQRLQTGPIYQDAAVDHETKPVRLYDIFRGLDEMVNRDTTPVIFGSDF